MSIDFSVVICTYNRADLLPGVLDSIFQQTLAPDRFEVLVINNASIDRTVDVVRASQEKYPQHQLHEIYESRQGLGYARNKGLANAKGKFIAYLDDDAIATPEWLSLAANHIIGTDKIHCLGGPILPFYTTIAPFWFKDQYESRNWGDSERYLIQNESLSGSNMIWHKDTLSSLNGFDVTIGVKGNNLSIGEETMSFRRLWQIYPEVHILYDPKLIVFHWVPPYKMKVKYYLKRAYVTGQVAIRLDRKGGIGWRLRTALRSCGAVVIHSVRASSRFHVYKHWQNWCIEECTPIAIKLGTSMAGFGITVGVKQK